MADRKWKIHRTHGPIVGEDLIDCLIDETETGFEFKDSEKVLLSETPGALTPTLPFTFPDFVYQDQTWRITVEELETGSDGHGSKGLWKKNPDDPDEEEDGSWTAEGIGKGADEDESATTAYA